MYIHNLNIDGVNDMFLTHLNQINKCDVGYTKKKTSILC